MTRFFVEQSHIREKEGGGKRRCLQKGEDGVGKRNVGYLTLPSTDHKFFVPIVTSCPFTVHFQKN